MHFPVSLLEGGARQRMRRRHTRRWCQIRTDVTVGEGQGYRTIFLVLAREFDDGLNLEIIITVNCGRLH